MSDIYGPFMPEEIQELRNLRNAMVNSKQRFNDDYNSLKNSIKSMASDSGSYSPIVDYFADGFEDSMFLGNQVCNRRYDVMIGRLNSY